MLLCRAKGLKGPKWPKGILVDAKKRGKRAEIKPFSSGLELAKHTPAFYFFKAWSPFYIDVLAIVFEKVVV